MQRDLYNNTKSLVALNPQTINTDTTIVGNIIDTQGFNSGKIVSKLGIFTLGTLTLKEINESDDSGMSGETVIPTARLQGALTALVASYQITENGFVATKRYIRAEWDSASSANLIADANCELGNPDQAPTK